MAENERPDGGDGCHAPSIREGNTMPQNRFSNPSERPSQQERRLDGVATAFGLFGDDWGRIHELVHVHTVGDWIEAEACEPLRVGMIVCVGFQAHGCVARRGVVEFCELEGDSHRVRVRLEARLAA
jgi:hypothetical protein